MKLKYVKRYLAYRSLPYLILFSTLGAALIFMASSNGKNELVAAVLICAAVMAVFFVITLINIYRFISMINRQEKTHEVAFSDKNSTKLSGFSPWLILSDDWLIRPGIFAIYIGEIRHASCGDCYPEGRHRIIYPTKIKTKSGKIFNVKTKSENDARLIRKWARQKLH